MTKRPMTPAYLFFYLLFWPDTWRIVIGLAAALLLAPRITPSDQGTFGLVMMHVMLACIGFAASAKPARGIAGFFRKRVLKGKRP